VLVVPFTAFAVYRFYQDKMQNLPVLGGKDHHIEEFHLIDQEGRAKSTQDWKNNIVVANFFFTHCLAVCPKMMNNLKTVNDHFKNDDKIKINSFSVDPVHDSVTQLQKYISQLRIPTVKWDLLTGSKQEIYKLARNSFEVVATDGDGGPDDFIHSDRLVLIDPQKRIRGYYDGTDKKEISQLIKDIKKLENEN
jgi:protein SCO1/2